MFDLTPHVIKGMGWKPQRPDPLDYRFRSRLHLTRPREVDLRRYGPPIMDQGKLGTCTAFAATRAMRHSIKRLEFPDVPLSCLQLYYQVRQLESTSPTEDSGAELRDVLKCAAKFGVAHDSLWPYTSDFTQEPPPQVYEDALLNQAILYEAVNVNNDAMVAALASGVPIIMGCMIYDSFSDVGSDGMVPMPDPQREKQRGGHALLVEGYRSDGRFIVANSWGASWAKDGYAFFPATYLASTSFAGDFWIIRLTEGFADSEMAQKLRDWATNPQAPIEGMATT